MSQISNRDGRPCPVGKVSDPTARAVVEQALQGGITFFDAYRGSEELLASLPAEVKRTLTLAAKAGLRPDGVRDFRVSYLEECLHQSLQRLDVECLDLFQLNKPDLKDLEDGSVWKFLERVKQSGKVRQAGVIVGDPQVVGACLDSGQVDCFQLLYNLLFQAHEPHLRQAAQHSKTIIVRSPLNSGVLSGRCVLDQPFPANDWRSQVLCGPQFQRRLQALAAIQRELKVPNEQLLEFALRFVLSNPSVSVVLAGASRPEQVLRYLAAQALPRFTESERLEIAAVANRHMLGVSPDCQL